MIAVKKQMKGVFLTNFAICRNILRNSDFRDTTIFRKKNSLNIIDDSYLDADLSILIIDIGLSRHG